MSMISRDERKKQKGIKKFLNSFTYPIKGLKYAYKNEQNLAFDVGMALVVVIFGFLFKVNKYEWAILVLTIGLVISCELINTAIEAVVDCKRYKCSCSISICNSGNYSRIDNICTKNNWFILGE